MENSGLVNGLVGLSLFPANRHWSQSFHETRICYTTSELVATFTLHNRVGDGGSGLTVAGDRSGGYARTLRHSRALWAFNRRLVCCSVGVAFSR